MRTLMLVLPALMAAPSFASEDLSYQILSRTSKPNTLFPGQLMAHSRKFLQFDLLAKNEMIEQCHSWGGVLVGSTWNVLRAPQNSVHLLKICRGPFFKMSHKGAESNE